MGLAMVAMVAMIAMLAFVVDAGMFFMIRRELQNTADAAVLAGAKYLVNPTPPLTPISPDPGCTNPPMPTGDADSFHLQAAQVACTYADLNVTRNPNSVAEHLCVGPLQMDPPTFDTWPGHPGFPRMLVNFHCTAGFSFGRILGLLSKTVSAHATAVVGNPQGGLVSPTAPVVAFGGTNPVVTRLIPD